MDVFLNPAAQFIAQPYFGVVAMAFILSIPFFLKKRQSGNHIQVIVTTAGMFGTFLGIVAGIYLLDLRVDHINASIQSLIGGLATAFLTSLGGIAASLAIQINPRGFPYNLPDQPEDSADIDPMDAILAELKTLNKNIASDEDGSITTQIVKMRSENNDNHKDLRDSFDEFAKQMAENNMKALIEAVQKVMDDFSNQINDHLGDNFKRLNEAVENMVIWQDQYREQLKVAVEALQESNNALGVSVESMSTFTERAQDFDHVSSQLKESLETMGASMTGLKNLADTLENSGQEIRDEMSDLTKQNLRDLGENLKGISEKLVEDYSYLQKMMQTVIDKRES